MRVGKLEIRGFRGIKHGEVIFRDNSIIIGPNNTGKTSIIEALALLLGREKMIRNYTEHDFFGSCPQANTRIRIIGTILGFEDDNPDNHREDWFLHGRAVEKWFGSDGSLSPHKREGDLLAAQIAVEMRFDLQELEAEIIRYFYVDDEIGDPFDDENVQRVPAWLIKELGFYLVPANRNWDKMISFNSELFRRVVGLQGGKPAESILDIRDSIRNPEKKIEEDDAIKPIIDDVNKELSRFFPDSTKLNLRLTTTDSEGILSGITPHYSKRDSLPVPARREGDGLLSLQTLILLTQFVKKRRESGSCCIVAIEE